MTLNNVLNFIFYFCLTSITISNLEANECSKYLNSRSSSSKELSFPNPIIKDLDIDYSAQPKSVTSSNEIIGLDELRKNIEYSARSSDLPIKTILYPAIGTDAITAFRIFPEATVVIGVDNNPFVNSETESLNLLDSNVNRLSYQGFNIVGFYAWGDKRNSADFVISDLKSAFPDLRIVSIKLIKIPSPTNPNKFSYSGKIEFMERPGEPVKTYYHLQLPFIEQDGYVIQGNNDPDFNFMVSRVLNFGFDGVIARGSMELFELGEGIEEKSLGFGRKILNYLFTNGGLLVDGDFISTYYIKRIEQDYPNTIIDLNPSELENPYKQRNAFIFGYKNGMVNILRFRIVK